jgi:hypothetical protein
LMRCLVSATALRGPRVSLGGSFSSPRNAMTANLNLAISEDIANQCSWRALFRVSLHPSP